MQILNINNKNSSVYLKEKQPSKKLNHFSQMKFNKGRLISPAFAGRVQCPFLSTKQISLINDTILNKFGNITINELKNELKIVQKKFTDLTESSFLSNIIPKCEFANIKDFDKVISYMKEKHMQLFVIEDIDISSSLAYLQTKRNPNDQVKIVKVPLENLAQKARAHSKKNPAIILTKYSIDSLEKMAQEKPEEFNKILKYTNFLYPKNSINGVNAFSLTGVKEIIEKGLTKEGDEKEIEKFLKICEENIKKYSSDESTSLKFHEIRNKLRYSLDSLIQRLKYRHRFFEKHDDTFMPVARLMRQMQARAGFDFFSSNIPEELSELRNSILKHTTLLTPIKLNRFLESLYGKISAKTNGNEVYYLPTFDKPKSFNYMLGSYFRINNIPKEKLVKDLSQIGPNQKVVVLDDYIGSGETMISQFEKLQKAGIDKKNIVLASLVSTKRGMDALTQHTKNVVSCKVISQYDVKRTGMYHSTAQAEDRFKLRELTSNTLIGGYNGGLDNFSTFYMTPNNNNNLFFSNIAPGFVMSSHGIKAAFNTFDQTIKKADLNSLKENELNEIIEIYKKANALIPNCIIKKIAELTPNNSDNLITVLHTYGKIQKPQIEPEIIAYLKTALADIDVKKVNNIFVIDNIMDVCNYLNVEPPIKFVSSMLNELQNPKTKVNADVLLHFYLKLINQLSPMKDINVRIAEIIKNLKPEQIIKFNILEDVLQIYNHNNAKIPQTILKRVYEVMDKVGEKNISLELFTLILKTPQIDDTKLDKLVCQKWWASIPESRKQSADQVVLDFFDKNVVEKGGNCENR